MINLQTEIHLALKLKMRRGHDIKMLEKVRIIIIQVMMTVHIHSLKIIMIKKKSRLSTYTTSQETTGNPKISVLLT